MNILKFLWQLPQNILGFLVTVFSGAKYSGIVGCYLTRFNFGVSLGHYIIIGQKMYCGTTLKHEIGHQKQSLYLGFLYLLLIGLPSITGNIIDSVFHCCWSTQARLKWYYSLLWEKWADSLGGVERNF